MNGPVSPRRDILRDWTRTEHIKCIPLYNLVKTSAPNAILEALLSQLKAFLSSRTAVLAWLEASFLCGHKTKVLQLNRIIHHIEAIRRMTPQPATDKDNIIAVVSKLQTEISTILDDFPHVVYDSPHTVWTSLTDFLGTQ